MLLQDGSSLNDTQINGVNILTGLALGGAAYGTQILVGYLLTRKLPSRDRMHIAFAQQNGITAIILALLFETYYPGTIAIVAPAILVINTLHATANCLLDVRWSKDVGRHVIMPQLRKLKAHMQKVG